MNLILTVGSATSRGPNLVACPEHMISRVSPWLTALYPIFANILLLRINTIYSLVFFFLLCSHLVNWQADIFPTMVRNRGWQTFSAKGQIISVLGFEGHLSHNSTLILCEGSHWWYMKTNGYDWFPVEPYFMDMKIGISCVFHMSRNSGLPLIFVYPLKNAETILRLWAIQKHTASQVWPVSWLQFANAWSTALGASAWLFSLMYRKWSPEQQVIQNHFIWLRNILYNFLNSTLTFLATLILIL